MPPYRIRVLVVDDSMMFRAFLTRTLNAVPEIEVVGTAGDPFEARDRIVELEPDVMTCDIEMPRMNGIEFVRRLIPQYPLPVVMISSVSEAVFDAMDAGAVDFAVKPDGSGFITTETFAVELVEKVRSAFRAKARAVGGSSAVMQPTQKPGELWSGIVAIAASTGGTEAISQLLQGLPYPFPGIAIVQHIPPLFSQMFASRLNDRLPFEVKEASGSEWLEPNKILIAPGDRHIRLKKLGGRWKIECFEGERVNGHCPSADVLFESVAASAADQAIGVILTGMGNDGARGLLAMRRRGARTIGQDEASCVVYGMPKAAYQLGAVERQAELGRIPQLLASWVQQ